MHHPARLEQLEFQEICAGVMGAGIRARVCASGFI